MKKITALPALACILTVAACATGPSALTFDNLDKDQDGLVKLADVKKIDKVATLQGLSQFDTNGDSQFDTTEFNAYLASEYRQTVLAEAEAERRRQQELQRIRNTTRSVGGGGGYGS